MPIALLDRVKFWFRSPKHSEKTPTFPSGVDGCEDGFVDDDGGPQAEGPDERGFNGKIAVRL